MLPPVASAYILCIRGSQQCGGCLQQLRGFRTALFQKDKGKHPDQVPDFFPSVLPYLSVSYIASMSNLHYELWQHSSKKLLARRLMPPSGTSGQQLHCTTYAADCAALCASVALAHLRVQWSIQPSPQDERGISMDIT